MIKTTPRCNLEEIRIADLIKGKGGFERKRQTARYEAARYMKDSGSEVFGRGVVLLPNLL